MNVLPRDWHEKLEKLLATTDDRTRSEPIEVYEEFQKRLHEEKPLEDLGLSFEKKSRWRRFVSTPRQVERYFKLRKIALELKLPIKEFKHTIQSEEEKGVRGRILSSEAPMQENVEETAIKRQEIEKAMATLTARQRKAIERWLAGGEMDGNAREGLRKIREKRLKETKT